jgi:hypothetical protein
MEVIHSKAKRMPAVKQQNQAIKEEILPSQSHKLIISISWSAARTEEYKQNEINLNNENRSWS